MDFFKRAKASVHSRVIRPYMSRHFERTGYGKTIASLKNQYVGQRCFIIGNGPSLRAEDLSVLRANNEKTFAFNRIYNIFDQTDWRPSFYLSQDKKMLGGCEEIVDRLELPMKLIPIQLKWDNGIHIHDAVYFNLLWGKQDQLNEILFSDDVAVKVYEGTTVVYTAVEFAVYMGFREIYLIGVDHHFRISQNMKGEIIVDNTAKDYFSDKYNVDREKLYIPNVEQSEKVYIAMKKHCEDRSVKVFNATRGGHLEVFPRTDFDGLFR